MYCTDEDAVWATQDKNGSVIAAANAVRDLQPGDVCDRPSTVLYAQRLHHVDVKEVRAGDLIAYCDPTVPAASLDPRYMFDQQDPGHPLVNVGIHSFAWFMVGVISADPQQVGFNVQAGLLWPVKARTGTFDSNNPKMGSPPCHVLGATFHTVLNGMCLVIKNEDLPFFIGGKANLLKRIEEVQGGLASERKITQAQLKEAREKEGELGRRFVDSLNGPGTITCNLSQSQFVTGLNNSISWRRLSRNLIATSEHVIVDEQQMRTMILMAGSDVAHGVSGGAVDDEMWVALKKQTSKFQSLRMKADKIFAEQAKHLLDLAMGRVGVARDKVSFDAFAKSGCHVDQGLVAMSEEEGQKTLLVQQIKNLGGCMELVFGWGSKLFVEACDALETGLWARNSVRNGFIYFILETQIYSLFTTVATARHDSVVGHDLRESVGCEAYAMDKFSMAKLSALVTEASQENWKRYAEEKRNWKDDLIEASSTPSSKRPLAAVTPPGSSESPPTKAPYGGKDAAGRGKSDSVCGYWLLEACGVKHGPAHENEALRDVVIKCGKGTEKCIFNHPSDPLTKEKGQEMLKAAKSYLVKYHAAEVKAFLDSMP